MAKKLTILLVDDHAVVRSGFKAFLALSEHIGEIHETEKGETVCRLYQQYRPDVVVLDLSMPGIGGFETIRRLINQDPLAKILVFSIHNEVVYVIRAIKAGAKGYITKNSFAETLISAVCSVANDESYIDPELAQQLSHNITSELDDAAKIRQLSPREFDVFCLLVNGYNSHKIAEKLRLSYKTACNHGTAIKDKLGVSNMAEMILLATRQGLINICLDDDSDISQSISN